MQNRLKIVEFAEIDPTRLIRIPEELDIDTLIVYKANDMSNIQILAEWLPTTEIGAWLAENTTGEIAIAESHKAINPRTFIPVVRFVANLVDDPEDRAYTAFLLRWS